MNQAVSAADPRSSDAEQDLPDSTSPSSTSNDVYTMEEAARLKGVSYHTVSRAVRSGRLPSHRLGRMAMMTAADLAAWQPMRERAPHKYRRREPEPASTPGVVDLASGERIELARRLSTLYETIHSSAMRQPMEQFGLTLADRLAHAMEFDRVAIWLLDESGLTIRRLASIGEWYKPGAPVTPAEIPYDPEAMHLVRAGVIDASKYWTSPAIDRLGDMFTAPLTIDQKNIGHIVGDRLGEPFSLTEAQIQLGQSLAAQAALTIELNRTRHREAQRTKELEAVLERISEPVMVYDADRRITAMSRVARRNYGLPEELDFAATPFSLLDLDLGRVKFHGTRSENPPSEIALSGQTVKDFEFEFARFDTGEARLLSVDATPIVENDVVRTVVAVEHDVTEQRADESRERQHRLELEETLRRTRAIAEVSLQLNAGVDLNSVLRKAGRDATHLMGSEIGGIGLQIDGESIIGMWTFGLETRPDEIMPVNMRALPGTMRSFREGKPTLNTYELASDEERRLMDAAGMRSSLITPFIIDGELIGAMYVKYPDDDPGLSEELLEFNRALAAQCIVAIKQARLKELLENERTALNSAVSELQELSEELRLLRERVDTRHLPVQSEIDSILELIQGTVGRVRAFDLHTMSPSAD
jgi:excisionase family DNA binding protein